MSSTFVEEAPADPEWDPLRRQLAGLFGNTKFEMALASALLFNVVLVWIEIDSEADRSALAPQPTGVPSWVVVLNGLLLAIYTAELVGKIYVYGYTFFTSAFSIAEFLIVVIDILMSIIGAITGGNMPAVSIFRVFRLSRLARAARVLVFFPELNLMIKGLKGAVNAILWGSLLVCVVLFLWSLVFVQVIHPLNIEIAETGGYDGCDRCVHAYESVMQAFLTFTQQVVAGDSWGLMTVPIIERHPWAYVLFLGVLVTVSFTIMNLMLAVIVDSAQEARKLSDYELVLQRDKLADQAKNALLSVCEEIDEDGGGTLCLEELLNGFDNHAEFQQAFRVMDIGRDDMGVVFSILDQDHSGDVDYHEFVNELHRMKQHDIHTMLIFIKHYVTELDVKITNAIKGAERDIIENMAPTSSASAGVKTETKETSKKFLGDPVGSSVVAPANSLEQQLKDGSSFLDSRDALPEMRQAHDELVTAMQGIAESFGSMLREQQAALAPAVVHPHGTLASGDSRGALHFGALPGAPPQSAGSAVGEDPLRLPYSAAVVDGVEVALPPWPRETKPKAPGCCAYAGPADR